MKPNTESRYVTIPELALRRNLKVSWLYERSRKNAVPGMVRYGGLVRIDLDEFDEACKAGALAEREGVK